MNDLLSGQGGPVAQAILWLTIGALSFILGPARWKTYKAHVDQLQEIIDDYENSLDRLSLERDRLRDDVIAHQMKEDALIKLLEDCQEEVNQAT